ncbi:anti-sigma factor family protein [Streptomyces sp. NPDC094448]|uniref:anti-sigma factor family protein n=1 Tax=Streptomyces sp. NPDC094448 TaxID=3366063 RepID=UPI00380CBB8A
MSGSTPLPRTPQSSRTSRTSPAEHHLGDRLAALVDGELTHDARDRVLAHLATCPRCKAEADAQRMLKDVFARSAPPPPSAGLLARLQGLPAGPGPLGSDGDDPRGGPFGGGRDRGSVFAAPVPADGRRPVPFGYLPGGHGLGGAPAPLGAGPRGFGVHEVGRPEGERSPWRGRRFAFAAASAVSFAAIALGGSMPVDGSAQAGPRSGGSGTGGTTAVNTGAGSGTAGTAQGTATGFGTSAAANRAAEYERRRNSGHGPTRSEERTAGRSVPGEPEVPLNLASLPAPVALNAAYPAFPAFKEPLIRPLGYAFHLRAPHGFLPSVASPAPVAPAAAASPAPGHRLPASQGPVTNTR